MLVRVLRTTLARLTSLTSLEALGMVITSSNQNPLTMTFIKKIENPLDLNKILIL